MDSDEQEYLVQIVNMLSDALRKACATDDMLTHIFASFALASPSNGEALRAHLSDVRERLGPDLTPEYLSLSRRMDWALTGKEMNPLSQTQESKDAMAAARKLLEQLQGRDKGTDGQPP